MRGLAGVMDDSFSANSGLEFVAACVRAMIPPVGEQDVADIQKQRRDRDRSFHLACINAVYPFVPRARSMALDRGPRW
jgi:hypothetical protein